MRTVEIIKQDGLMVRLYSEVMMKLVFTLQYLPIEGDD